MNPVLLLSDASTYACFQTCGLEILYHQAKAMGGEESSWGQADDDPKWPPFLQKLKSCDYFGSEVEGSEGYQEKLKSAREYFVDMRRHGDGADHTDEE